MIKVITYGTYDLLHFGHIRLLERAKALGDYLIVGVTADDFDISRGKINVHQSLIERIEAVRATGLADEILVEEYEGQKIEDIVNNKIDIFTVGDDWKGKFDYLNEFCQVIYLDRTRGVSSTEIRGKENSVKMGFVGDNLVIDKVLGECKYVNGITTVGYYTRNNQLSGTNLINEKKYDSYEALVESCDALYIQSHPENHYSDIKYALSHGKHVLFESPLSVSSNLCNELIDIATENDLILYEGIKTAYSIAYARMILMAKAGKIGEIISVDANCTSLQKIPFDDKEYMPMVWNSICAWGPTALLPIFQLLGTEYKNKRIITRNFPSIDFDMFTKIDFIYPNAVASIKVGKGIKSEGELIITGTKGYIYVPAPWWKTDYFELRYENPSENKRYFYQLDGEGIRNELVSFIKSIIHKKIAYIKPEITKTIVRVIDDYENGIDTLHI